MQVIINKCFHLNPDKNLLQVCLVAFEKKSKNFDILILKNDIT